MINNFIAKSFNLSIAEISAEMHLIYDCMADSLMLIDLFIELENYYQINFTRKDIENIETVGDIYNFLGLSELVLNKKIITLVNITWFIFLFANYHYNLMII